MALLLSIGLPVGAEGQMTAVTHSCLDTISPSAFARVPVYLEAKAVDSSARELLAGADTIAFHAAAVIRSSLGEQTASLPEGEMLLQWREVGGSVRIEAHRDGHFTWSTPVRDGQDSLHAPSRLLLAQTVAALSKAGAKIGWPSDVAGDSAAIDLVYRWPDVTPEGVMKPLLVRIAAMPMFSMAMPRSKEVAVRRPPKIVFPPGMASEMAEGRVMLEFVVDTAGRAVTSSIKDILPEGRPRGTRQFTDHYQAFVNAAKWGLSTARFEPATVGGCPVSQLAQQPFDFSSNR